MEIKTESKRIAVFIDGKTNYLSAEEMTENQKILISLADASSLLETEFRYDEGKRIITAAVEDYSIELTVDEEKAQGSRLEYVLDTPPMIKNGAVMVPLDFVSEQLGYSFERDEKNQTVTLKKPELFRDEANSEYEKYAIARARLLTEFCFTPLCDIPTALSKTTPGIFEAGKEYKGFPYSSTEENDKFFCENVSFHTFLSALSNPDSVIYTKNMYHSSNASTYYGIVCNSFVRYCIGIKNRCNTQHWMEISGMSVVAEKGSYTVNDLALCDVLHAYGEGRNHVAIITGILRDASGNIARVEVSEACRPSCRRRLFTPSDFLTVFEKFCISRYERLDSIPPFDEDDYKLLFESGLDKQKPMIAVDYGDKSNYLYGDTTVISCFAEGENTVQVFCNGALTEEITVNGYERISRQFDGGYYVIKLAGTDYFTEFCVCKPDITHTVENGVITVNASAGDRESKILHMEFRAAKIRPRFAGLVSMVALTEEELKMGVIVQKIPEKAKSYKISFENKYGIWTHTVIEI